MAELRSRCRHYIFALLFMVTLWNRADHIYIFMLWFVLFFPRLISAAADWMSGVASVRI